MKRILLFIAIFSGTVVCQDNRIAEFAFWQPYPGQEMNFQLGYKRHLQWRKSSRDSWEWHGWKIISGPRAGHFVVGTFDHYWADFDRPLNPNDDLNDKMQNVFPIAEMLSVHKATFLKGPSIGTAQSLKSKPAVVRMITLKVSDIAASSRILDRLKAGYNNSSDISFLLSFKKIDGGEVNELTVMLGFESWELFGKSENIQEQLISIENALKLKVIQSVRSEALAPQADLSLFPGEEYAAGSPAKSGPLPTAAKQLNPAQRR